MLAWGLKSYIRPAAFTIVVTTHDTNVNVKNYINVVLLFLARNAVIISLNTRNILISKNIGDCVAEMMCSYKCIGIGSFFL